MTSDGHLIISGSSVGAFINTGSGGVGQEDALLLKLNSSNGNVIWGKQFGGIQNDRCNSVAVDSNGYIYCGGFSDGSFGRLTPDSTSTGTNGMIFKTTSDGVFLWGRVIGNTAGTHSASNSTCLDMEIDAYDNVYCAGVITATATTGITQNKIKSLLGEFLLNKAFADEVSSYVSDTFISKFDSDGGLLFRNFYDSANGEEICYSFDGNASDIFLCGGYKSFYIDNLIVNKDINIIGFLSSGEQINNVIPDVVKVDDSNNFYYYKQGQIKKLNSCGEVQYSKNIVCDSIDVDSSENMYCLQSGRIRRFNSSGTLTYDGYSALPSTDATFNSNFSYRRAITVTSSNSYPETEINVMVEVDTAAIITAGKMNSDCSDIMLTDANGTSIPHWVADNSCNTEKTYIWTKVPFLKNGDNNLYFYYGDGDYTSSYAGTDVFVSYFEDFNNITVNDLEEGGDLIEVPNSRLYDNLAITPTGEILIQQNNGSTLDPSTVCQETTMVAKRRRINFYNNQGSVTPGVSDGELYFTNNPGGYSYTGALMNFYAPINKAYSMVYKVRFDSVGNGAYTGMLVNIGGSGFAHYSATSGWHLYSRLNSSGTWHKNTGGLSTNTDFIFRQDFYESKINKSCIYGCNGTVTRNIPAGTDIQRGGTFNSYLNHFYAGYDPKMDYQFYLKNSEGETPTVSVGGETSNSVTNYKELTISNPSGDDGTNINTYFTINTQELIDNGKLDANCGNLEIFDSGLKFNIGSRMILVIRQRLKFGSYYQAYQAMILI